MTNHLPVFKSIIFCGGTIPIGESADAHAPITCLHCREKIAAKVDAHRAEAARHADGSQQHRFFSADADRNQRILDAA
jgi:hypothetical protein